MHRGGGLQGGAIPGAKHQLLLLLRVGVREKQT
jgi:hypothetical protein